MTASAFTAHRKILHRGICWRSAAMLVVAAMLAFQSTALIAQEERPEIPPGERKAPRKKEAGPRAIGVLQLHSDNKATLVPIAILVGGKFWDATAYKADPIPMALEAGTVYEAERAGNSLGLFTVGGALQSRAVNVQAPWLGTGIWQPVGTEPAKKQMTAESAPVGIGLEDAPPRLTRDPKAADAPAAKSTGTSGGDKDSKAPAPDNSKPTDSNSGDGPPRLKKGTPSSSDSSTDASSSAPPTAPKDTKEDDKKKANESKPAAPMVPASDSGASEGDRPVLRRGRPAVSFADVDIPGYSKPGTPAPKSSGKVSEVAAASGDVQLIPAISDATVSIPRSFTFEWLKGEESDRRKQMLDLAKDQLRAYVAARAKAKITPRAAHGQVARAPKTPEPLLDNVQMVAYDLWNSNQAIIVLSAQAHMPPPAPNAAHSEVDADLKYSIMLVAYPDMYNNLHKLHSSVTDQFHLDLTPRLELVDAMDADGDGRGELLFRETTDSGSGWVVYRATADKLSKMFDSLRPQ